MHTGHMNFVSGMHFFGSLLIVGVKIKKRIPDTLFFVSGMHFFTV